MVVHTKFINQITRSMKSNPLQFTTALFLRYAFKKLNLSCIYILQHLYNLNSIQIVVQPLIWAYWLRDHRKNEKHKLYWGECLSNALLSIFFSHTQIYTIHFFALAPNCISMFKLWLFIHFGMMMIKWIKLCRLPQNNTFFQSNLPHNRSYLHNLIYNVVHLPKATIFYIRINSIDIFRGTRDAVWAFENCYVDETDVYDRKFSMSWLRIRCVCVCLRVFDG